MNLFSRPARLIDLGNSLFEIDARFNRPQHFVTGSEHAIKQGKLFGQQFVNSLVGGIILVQKVYDNDIMFLAIAMATANTLFNALGIPWKVVVDDHGAKLQVDTFGCGFGGDHNFGTVAKVVH